MTPNEINKRISNACGVIPQEGYFCHHCGYSVAGKYVTFDERHDLLKGGCGGHLGIWSPTNYHGDLNAMHEAEKVLTEKGVNYWWEYVNYINRLNPTPFGHETAVHATAAQRAEAFLRTIGQWEDGE